MESLEPTAEERRVYTFFRVSAVFGILVLIFALIVLVLSSCSREAIFATGIGFGVLGASIASYAVLQMFRMGSKYPDYLNLPQECRLARAAAVTQLLRLVSYMPGVYYAHGNS